LKTGGQLLNKIFKESLDETAILSELDVFFATYKKEKINSEKFGDFVMRKQPVLYYSIKIILGASAGGCSFCMNTSF
jgi:sulfite reductase beta subunit-like hemoprotein